MVENATPRSAFVTGVAWTFIALSGMSTLISILQNIMLVMMLPPEGIDMSLPGDEDLPPVVRFFAENGHMVFVAFLMLSAVTFVASIGLLIRKNWARLIFIAILVFGIAWNIGGLVLSFYVLPEFVPPEGAPEEFRENMAMMTKLMIAFNVVIALVVSGLFIWIIKRLTSAEIRREFQPAGSVGS